MPGKCSKARFRTEIAAKLRIAKLQKIDDPKREKVPQRAYFCTNCRGWHLTSQGRGAQ